jgi:hypothetical protein
MFQRMANGGRAALTPPAPPVTDGTPATSHGPAPTAGD